MRSLRLLSLLTAVVVALTGIGGAVAAQAGPLAPRGASVVAAALPDPHPEIPVLPLDPVLSGAGGSWTHYKWDSWYGPYHGTSSGYAFRLTGGSGDAVLYVKQGGVPTETDYTCKTVRTDAKGCELYNPAGVYYFSVKGGTAYSGTTLSTVPFPSTPDIAVDPPTLTDGTSATLSSHPRVGYWRWARVVVPSGLPTVASLKLTTSGGTGDIGLYVARDRYPTWTSRDCRSNVAGNTQTCAFDNPAPGTYWVGLRGDAPFENVTLRASMPTAGGGTSTTSPSPYPLLTPGEPVTVSGSSGQMKVYAVQLGAVPTGSTARLAVSISGGTGDADLYVRRAAAPTTSAYDCFLDKAGNEETCTLSITASTAYVAVRGYTSYANVQLRAVVDALVTPTTSTPTATTTSTATATATPDEYPALVPGAATTVAGGYGSFSVYKVVVPEGAAPTRLTVGTSGGTGDVDLYVRKGSAPTSTAYDCRPYKTGSAESCTFTAPNGTYYVGLRGYSSFSGVQLLVTLEGMPATTSAVAQVAHGRPPSAVGSVRRRSGPTAAFARP